MRPLKRLTLLFAALILGSCSSMSDVLESKDEGMVKVYDVDPDEAWEISRTVFRWADSDAIEEHRQDDYMLASAPGKWLSEGAVMGAWVEPAEGGKSKVTIVSLRRVATNLYTPLSEEEYHEYFAEALAMVEAGESLPVKRPEDAPVGSGDADS